MPDPEAPDQTESPQGLTRRDFLSHAGTAGLAGLAASMPLVAAATEIAQAPPEALEIAGTVPIALRINGKTYKVQIDPRATLLDTLRETVRLTARRRVRPRPVRRVHCPRQRRPLNSCLRLALMHEGDDITTSKGSAPRRRCTQCRPRLSRTTATSAATARQGDHVAGRADEGAFGPTDADVKN